MGQLERGRALGVRGDGRSSRSIQKDSGTAAWSGPGSEILFYAFLVAIAVVYGGLDTHVPLLKVLHFNTILIYSIFFIVLIRYGVKDILSRAQARILISLAVFTALSVLWAVVSLYAFQSIRPMVDYLVLLVVVVTLVDRPARVEALSWTISFICIFLVATNLTKLLSGSRSGFFKSAYFMGDGNDFAWGFVIFFPFILNLIIGSRSWVARLFGTIGLAACLLGIIGSGSRGGSIGLVGSIVFYWLLFSKRKMVGAIAMGTLLGGVLLLAPSTYTDRMQSVTEYQGDSSAQGRLQAWRASVRMAIDHPLGVGAGNFGSAYGRFYRPTEEQNAIAWAPGRWLSAHSIYFRILGEYGFIGLALLISVIWLNIRDNMSSNRVLAAMGDAGKLSPTWPALLSMAIVGYALCGIFLGGLSYPHLYLLTGLTIAFTRMASSGRAEEVVAVSKVSRLRRN